MNSPADPTGDIVAHADASPMEPEPPAASDEAMDACLAAEAAVEALEAADEDAISEFDFAHLIHAAEGLLDEARRCAVVPESRHFTDRLADRFEDAVA